MTQSKHITPDQAQRLAANAKAGEYWRERGWQDGDIIAIEGNEFGPSWVYEDGQLHAYSKKRQEPCTIFSDAEPMLLPSESDLMDLLEWTGHGYIVSRYSLDGRKQYSVGRYEADVYHHGIGTTRLEALYNCVLAVLDLGEGSE